MIKPLGN